MAIPLILPYGLPLLASLPINRAAWRAEPQRAALLIHDMQRYFVKPFADGSPIAEVLQNIVLVRAQARQLQLPIFYTAQPGAQGRLERGLLQDFWGSGLADDLESTEIVESLSPGVNEPVIRKRRYSAFYGTDLLEQLRGSGRDQLIITGVYAHIGCLATALEGFMSGIQAFMVADAVADFSAGHHEMALQYVAGRCGCVLSSSRLLADLHPTQMECGPADAVSPTTR